MTPPDAGPLWLSDCVACLVTFCNGPEQAGVCVNCGHENHYTDEELSRDG